MDTTDDELNQRIVENEIINFNGSIFKVTFIDVKRKQLHVACKIDEEKKLQLTRDEKKKIKDDTPLLLNEKFHSLRYW